MQSTGHHRPRAFPAIPSTRAHRRSATWTRTCSRRSRPPAHDAQQDGVTLVITSGWRSRAHQQRLLDEAVTKYGSEEAARRFVSTPDSSAHVTGDAVDIGPTAADDWLSQHGAAYGLCQVFANEIWHFELATTPGGQYPEMYPDSSYRG